MKQYVNKNSVEKILKELWKTDDDEQYSEHRIFYNKALQEVQCKLDTLEMKEVDFETEWKKYFEHRGDMATVNVKDLAKHFFEFGLKTKGEKNYDKRRRNN